jgi:signal peptidase I
MTTNPEGEDPVPKRRSVRRSRGAAVIRRVRVGVWSLVLVLALGGAGVAAVSVISGAWDVAPILSGSMRPGFPVGGVAVAEREPVSQLALRDVIIFKNPFDPNIQMVHRIIQLKFNKSGQAIIKTQGDANTAADPWTVRLGAKYVYEVQFTLPLLGYPGVYTNHAADLIIAGTILLLVVGGAVLGRERDHGDEKLLPGGAASPRTKEVWPEYQPVSRTGEARPAPGSASGLSEGGPEPWR